MRDRREGIGEVERLTEGGAMEEEAKDTLQDFQIEDLSRTYAVSGGNPKVFWTFL